MYRNSSCFCWSGLPFCWLGSLSVWQMCYLWKGILNILKHWLLGSSPSQTVKWERIKCQIISQRKISEYISILIIKKRKKRKQDRLFLQEANSNPICTYHNNLLLLLCNIFLFNPILNSNFHCLKKKKSILLGKKNYRVHKFIRKNMRICAWKFGDLLFLSCIGRSDER